MSAISKMCLTVEVANGGSTAAVVAVEVELVKCECCGLKEECTPAYIGRVRERFYGKWVCGLCAEAVKEELCRASSPSIGMEEALHAHMTFCLQFTRCRTSPAMHLADAMRQILRRSPSRDAGRGGGAASAARITRSNPPSPRGHPSEVGRGSGIPRSASCISTLAR